MLHRRSLTALALAATAVVLTAPLLAAGPSQAAEPATAAYQPGTLASQDLASAGQGSPWYRIPALTVTTMGTVLAAYDARPTLGDLPSNIHIVLRRSTDNGQTWQDQQVVRQDPAPRGYGDPSLVVDQVTGRVFLFYAAGQNQGFAGGATGTDEDDPNVLQADYSYSDDDGLTWQHRRITSQVKEPQWGGFFAASGQGIQVKRGAHAGRLVQQYTVRYQGKNWAMSAYSDDHGQTWHHGELVGPGMDENKSVELSDGRLMLNVRSKPFRKVAYSSDGGQTWTGLHDDTNLVDPADNGSILRYNASAPAGTQQADWLLFTNNESTSSRSNLVVKQSCDNGQTWPIRKVVEPGFAAYSTVTRLPDGTFGLLWESQDYSKITFSRFDRAWLGGVCAPLVLDTSALAVGQTRDVVVTVTSQATGTVSGGTVRLDLPEGWAGGTASVAPLKTGASATVRVPVTIPSGAIADAYPLRATFSSDRGHSTNAATVRLPLGEGGQVPVDRALLRVASVDSQETVGEDGQAGNALDGVASTFWHTQWKGAQPGFPHQLTIDTGVVQPLAGLRYLPRQDSATNGDVKDFSVDVSTDGSTWAQVFAGAFSGSKYEKELTFPPREARYIRFEAHSAVNGAVYASAAELLPLRQP